MKNVFLEAMRETYDLNAMLAKIDYHHIRGHLTDAEREELVAAAREKADPMGGVDIKGMLIEHEERLQKLEKSNTESNDNTESDGSPDTANAKPYEIGTWYKAGDIMLFDDGIVYRCKAPYGYIRAWSPVTHPDCWEAVNNG